MVLGIMALVAIIAVVWSITRDTQDNSHKAGQACATSAIDTRIPKPADVKVQILNATDKPGLANVTGDAFKKRGFNVVQVGNSTDVISGTAEIRFGAAAVGAAHLVRAEVPDSRPIADNTKTDNVVVVVLGPGFINLTAEGDLDSTLKSLGKPVRPKLACEA
ncbi:MAG: LytR C-terminal domain-containing protein [Mycobacteriales bacterium]